MAACTTPQFRFKKLILQIAESLKDKDCASLNYLFDIESEGCKNGLAVMKELHTQGHFDYQQPERLEGILTEIKRFDLVKIVQNYQEDLSKKQGARKTKKTHKAQVDSTPDQQKAQTRSGMLATTLVTALHVHCQMLNLIDESVRENLSGTRSKKEADAIENLKKCSNKLKESYQKGIEIFNRSDRVQEESQLPQMTSIVHEIPQVAKKIRPTPPPKPEKETPGSSHSNTPSLTR